MLVTGASSGVGWALAVRAARAGYGVYAVGRDRERLAALETKIGGEGGLVAVEAADIAVAARARELVARTLGRFGSLDVLVNNAGFVSAGPLARQSDAELQRQFATHVSAPIALVGEALDALRAVGGHVFMVGSGVARVPVGGLGAYPPAKAALRSATAILRRELRPLGVAVTYVDPGAIDTPFMRRAGMNAAPPALLVTPETVARKMLIAVARRPAELNVVPWQTASVALAERFPRLTERLLERAPSLIGGQNKRDEASPISVSSAIAVAEQPVLTDAPAADVVQTSFEAALEPHRRRMDKLNLRESFVRALLTPGARLDAGEIALQWAGMPNKNERAITADVLEALVDAGFLERGADHGYMVLRAP